MPRNQTHLPESVREFKCPPTYQVYFSRMTAANSVGMRKVWEHLEKQTLDGDLQEIIKPILNAAERADTLCSVSARKAAKELISLSKEIGQQSGELVRLIDRFGLLYLAAQPHIDEPAAGWSLPPLFGHSAVSNLMEYRLETFEDLARAAYTFSNRCIISKHRRARVFCETLLQGCKERKGWTLPDGFRISPADMVTLANTVLDLKSDEDGRGFTVAAMRDYNIQW